MEQDRLARVIHERGGRKLAVSEHHIVWKPPMVAPPADLPDPEAHRPPVDDIWIQSETEDATSLSYHVFWCLNRNGVPTHYIGRNGTHTFHARCVTLLPGELVIWRMAHGRYITRFNAERHARIDPLVVEHLYKHRGREVALHWEDKHFELHTPSIRYDRRKAFSTEPADLFNAMTGRVMTDALHREIETLARQAFLVLESAWLKAGFVLASLTLKCGWTLKGELVVAGTFDPASCSLMTDDPSGLRPTKLSMEQLLEITYGFAPLQG